MNKDLRKKLLTFLGITVGLIVLILLIVWIVRLVSGNRMSYEKVEDTMKNAAIEYYKVHNNLLPSNGGEVSVDAETLAETNFMKPLDELVKKGSSCTGVVYVKQLDDGYSYRPILDCGEDYYSIELYKALTKDENIVTTGDGLYKINNEYIYRGEDINNYVKIGDKTWRIVRITEDNEVELILTNSKIKNVWDDRYNSEKDRDYGINDYKVSRVKSYLDDLYEGNTLFNEKQKAYLTTFTSCYGKRSENQLSHDGSSECAMQLNNQKISLLPAYLYLTASLDTSCHETTDPACQNYNYLATEEANWWLLTASSENTYHVFSVSYSGEVNVSRASSNQVVRPVIHLSSLTKLANGNGTQENPYIIK